MGTPSRDAASPTERCGLRQWNATEAYRDQATNNIGHKFWSTKTARGNVQLSGASVLRAPLGPQRLLTAARAGLPELTRAISMLSPGSLNTFSAGKYEQSDHIEPHDDRHVAPGQRACARARGGLS
jgi:hypothetical protein